MAWQSGITGIGVNKDLVQGEITKMDDLANPDKVIPLSGDKKSRPFSRPPLGSCPDTPGNR